MNSQQLARRRLPDSPGVYIFRDARRRPLYIGRATSLRDRTKSYFAADLISTRGPRLVDMISKAASVSWQETGSVLEAILLESELIKRYQPFYNVDERDDKSSQYVIITDEPWPRVFLARARDFDQHLKEARLPYAVKRSFGPYPQGLLIKEALRVLRKMFPFRDKKSADPRHDAFYRALGRSPQSDDNAARRRYARTVDGLILFFEGKRARLKQKLEHQMKICARELRFEEAGEIKRLLYALDHINDMALIKEDRRRPASGRPFRIEAFDIAHLSGMETVGAVAVSVNGRADMSQYRKFKVSRNANDDMAGLTEILSRRLNHPEWPYPDLIVVDGNDILASRAEAVLSARRMAIPVIAVTKDERHRADKLVGNPELVERYRREIIATNAEAHRFAISYHRARRRKGFLA